MDNVLINIEEIVEDVTINIEELSGDNVINIEESSTNVSVNVEKTLEDVTINVEKILDEVTINIEEGRSGGLALWGDIAGTLSNQIDLQAELDGKEDIGGVTSWGDIVGTLSDQTDLQLELDGKEDVLGFTPADELISIIGAGLLSGQGGDLTTNRVFTLNNSDIDHSLLDASSLMNDDHVQYFLASGARAMSGNIVMGDNNITGINNLVFTDINGQISGIENQNLVDKSAIETISGLWNWTDNIRSLNFDTTSGTRNIHIGDFNLSSGENNILIRKSSTNPTITGSNNVGIGAFTLDSAISVVNSVAIGSNALKSLVSAGNCVAIGDGALESLVSAGSTFGLGHDAGKNLTGSQNVAIGDTALANGGAGTKRIAIGSQSGNFCTGDNNITLGEVALRGASSHTSKDNIVIGGECMMGAISADRNVVLGYRAGSAMSTSDDNVIVGEATCFFLTTGNKNVILGRTAGLTLTSGSSNIVIGYLAANGSLTTQSNRLWIENSGLTTPLIYGEFDNRLIKFNANTFTLAPSTADTDAVMNFTGTTNSGVFTWMEDEDYFKFSDDILIETSEKLNLRDTAIGIYSQANTFLDLFADGAVRIGDSSAGSPTNYMEIESDGDINFVSGAGLQYGGISVKDNVVITTLNSAAKIQVTIFDTNDTNNGSVTPDHTNNHITVGKAGDYMVVISIAVNNNAVQSHQINVGVFKNNGVTQFNNVHAHRNLTGGLGDVGSISLSGIITVVANDTIELWANTDIAANRSVTFEDVTMSLFQIGG